MISVEKAFERIVTSADLLGTERLPIAECSGRVLTAPIKARRSQPGCDVSAMDGYAVISTDLTGSHAEFQLVGESAAGTPFEGAITSGQAVRIFTGAAVPDGADQVVIQENTGPCDGGVFTDDKSQVQRHIRLAGYDFNKGQIVLEGGAFITPKAIGIAASAGHGHLMVYRAPKVALLATGDELVSPDAKTFEEHVTVNSTVPQLAAMLSDIGADVQILEQAGDELNILKSRIEDAKEADVLVTIGGASVGDKDFMQEALSAQGMKLDFWKVAMKPGKPLIYGRREQQHVLGLPGNPASAFVCALLYLRPLVDRLMGRPAPLPTGVQIPVATALKSNGPRQDYMRARLIGDIGSRSVDPAVSQDSGQLSVLSQSDGLIVRPPNAPAIEVGSRVPFIPF
jgi:molybdopterin molybdotransferase